MSQLLEGTTIKSHTVNIKIILLLGCIAISKNWLQLNYFSLIFFFFFSSIRFELWALARRTRLKRFSLCKQQSIKRKHRILFASKEPLTAEGRKAWSAFQGQLKLRALLLRGNPPRELKQSSDQARASLSVGASSHCNCVSAVTLKLWRFLILRKNTREK